MNDPIVLSPWMMVEGHCSMRVILGSDGSKVCNRIAFIEKTPRVRFGECTEKNDFDNWLQGPKGCGTELGRHQESRDWCDQQLLSMGYVLL